MHMTCDHGMPRADSEIALLASDGAAPPSSDHMRSNLSRSIVLHVDDGFDWRGLEMCFTPELPSHTDTNEEYDSSLLLSKSLKDAA